MACLIDSSVLVALERGGLGVGALAETMPDEPVAIASITASELLAGVYRADCAVRRAGLTSVLHSRIARASLRFLRPRAAGPMICETQEL